MEQPIVTSSPDILSGTPVFAGTRVPVQSLIDYLEGGETIDDFLEGFPTVKRKQGRSIPGEGCGTNDREGIMK